MTVFFRVSDDRYRIEIHDAELKDPVVQQEMTVAEMLSYSDRSGDSPSKRASDVAFAARAGLYDEDLVLSILNQTRPSHGDRRVVLPMLTPNGEGCPKDGSESGRSEASLPLDPGSMHDV